MNLGPMAVELAYTPPEETTQRLDQVLGYLAWLVTAAGVAGLLIVGTRMALALKTGDAEEHLRAYLIVLGACVIAACAGPLVEFVGLDFWNTVE
jgi:peptidoglycan/LPS O-acetylase OafA/YrhL